MDGRQRQALHQLLSHLCGDELRVVELVPAVDKAVADEGDGEGGEGGAWGGHMCPETTPRLCGEEEKEKGWRGERKKLEKKRHDSDKDDWKHIERRDERNDRWYEELDDELGSELVRDKRDFLSERLCCLNNVVFDKRKLSRRRPDTIPFPADEDADIIRAMLCEKGWD